jgi:hypothetical protein
MERGFDVLFYLSFKFGDSINVQGDVFRKETKGFNEKPVDVTTYLHVKGVSMDDLSSQDYVR